MRFLSSNAVVHNCRLSGRTDKPALLFINSLGTDYRIWDAVVPALEDDYHIICYDKRGHGLSEAPAPPYRMRDLAHDGLGLLDQLNIKRATVIGISVGGMIAQDMAALAPERIHQLVLCDTAPKIGTPEMWNKRIDTLRSEGMAHLQGAILSRWFAPAFEQNDPVAYRGYAQMYARTTLNGYTGTCEAIRDADLTEATGTIQAETHVICGAEDSATTPALVKGLVDLMPNAVYTEIPNAGHLPCVENPSGFLDALKGFFK